MTSAPPQRPDRIDPQAPPETPVQPNEPVPTQPPEFDPPPPDFDQPDRSPDEVPPDETGESLADITGRAPGDDGINCVSLRIRGTLSERD